MLPEKWKEYLDKPLWPNRIVFYLILFIAVLSVFGIAIFIFKNLFSDFSIVSNIAYTQYNTTQLSDMGFFDNERYLLSALVQSLAAVIALVITLSLVAVQLAAQSYSARVIDVYKRNPDMWILLSIYIITIFYGLGLIKIIGLGILGNYMEGAIFGAYFLGFFAFVCLVPYMWKTLELLKPSAVIKLLAEEITKDNVLEPLTEDGEISERDPIQPIIDMMNSALERNDYETLRNGLLAIKVAVNNIYETASFEGNEENMFSYHILSHIKRIGLQAANRKNEVTVGDTAKNIAGIYLKSSEKKHELTQLIATIYIGEIGQETTEMKLKIITKRIVDLLGIIGKNAVNIQNEEVIKNIVLSLEKIATKSTEHELSGVVESVSESLALIGQKSVETKNENIANFIADRLGTIKIEPLWPVAKALGKIGIDAVENSLQDTAEIAAEHLLEMAPTEDNLTNYEITDAMGKIGINSIEMKYEDTIETAIDALYEIGMEQEDIRTASKISEYLGDIGIKSIEKNLENTMEASLNALLKIGNNYARNNSEFNIWAILGALQKMGAVSIELRNKSATKIIIETLGNIGITAAEMKLPWEPEFEDKKMKSNLPSISRRELEELLDKSKENDWEDIVSLIEDKLQEIEKTRNDKDN